MLDQAQQVTQPPAIYVGVTITTEWSPPCSWACLRAQTLDPAATPTPAPAAGTSEVAGAADWLDGADDWGEEDENGNGEFGEVNPKSGGNPASASSSPLPNIRFQWF